MRSRSSWIAGDSPTIPNPSGTPNARSGYASATFCECTRRIEKSRSECLQVARCERRAVGLAAVDAHLELADVLDDDALGPIHRLDSELASRERVAA